MLTRRRLLTSLAGIAALGGGSAFWASRMAIYSGPPSDHFDGTRFFDPDGAPPRQWSDVLRWRMTAERAQWPDWTDNERFDPPPPRVDGLRITFIGHASWLVQTAGRNILIDPVWSERVSPVSFAGPKRHNAPGVAFDALPRIDLVLVTHGHYDHLDIDTLSRLARRDNPRVITPLGNDVTMHSYDRAIRASAIDWHQRIEAAGLAVTAVPTRHWTARGPFDRNKALWASFLIETPQGLVYAVGDSGYGTGLHFRRVRERYGAPKVALLPIGAYEPRWFMRDQHMNPEDAVKAMLDCGAERALAHHHGTFQLTDEAIDAPVIALKAALAVAGLPAERFPAPKRGEAVVI
jgi:L-ascorbate metabolism protein UlaG (beta-lactamase superfamily)